MGKLSKQMDAAGVDDKVLSRQVAIIQSMTKAERKTPQLMQASRKKRVARGAGVEVSEVNRLLKMHRQMSDMMKKLGKGGKKGMARALGAMMGKGGGMPAGMPGLPGGMPPGIAPGMPALPPDMEKLAGAAPKGDRAAEPAKPAPAFPAAFPGLGQGNPKLPSGLAGLGKKK